MPALQVFVAAEYSAPWTRETAPSPSTLQIATASPTASTAMCGSPAETPGVERSAAVLHARTAALKRAARMTVVGPLCATQMAIAFPLASTATSGTRTIRHRRGRRPEALRLRVPGRCGLQDADEDPDEDEPSGVPAGEHRGTAFQLGLDQRRLLAGFRIDELDRSHRTPARACLRQDSSSATRRP